MKIKLSYPVEEYNPSPIPPKSVKGICPHCKHQSVLQPINAECTDISASEHLLCGQRACSNPQCNGHVFVVREKNGELKRTYPYAAIDFDSTNIPENILNTFEEALKCHANKCYVASAIMVRRTLEEICKNKEAEGKNLKIRLENLKTKIVIPAELLEAMDELRLLGNDAAHIEAKDFCKISNEELEIAISITKEIMKSLYQYEDLLGKIRALKQP